MPRYLLAGLCSLAIFVSNANAHQPTPNDHAPIGIMGDHMHKTGSIMVGYKYELTRISGLRIGTDSVSNASVMATYGEIPAKMDMGMHMFEIMYGVTDNLTLMVMPQYMEMGMTHQSSHGGGHIHTHNVKGFGDTEVTGLYSFYQNGNNRAHLNVGLSLPTGSIDKTFIDHHDNVYNLPYNMQFGSGTVDPIIGVTYAGESQKWAWGLQTINYVRAGKNNHGYRQGNEYGGNAWISHNMSEILSASFRLEGKAWGNVRGRDYSLPLTAIAGANPKQQAGERMMANIGVNLLGDSSVVKGHRLAFEIGLPIYERAEGPQPKTDYRYTLGWQYAF